MNIQPPVQVPTRQPLRAAGTAFVPVTQTSGPALFAPIPIPQEQFPTWEFAAITVTIASAATIGANMVDVQNGTLSKSAAVVNGLAKGAAATVILSLTEKKTLLDIGLTAAALAGAGYMIDRIMKKAPEASCDAPEEPAQ